MEVVFELEPLEKGVNYYGKPHEGSRGGHVIGHTKSGKAIYDHRHATYHDAAANLQAKQHPGFHGWSAEDHAEAAELHADNSRKIAKDTWEPPGYSAVPTAGYGTDHPDTTLAHDAADMHRVMARGGKPHMYPAAHYKMVQGLLVKAWQDQPRVPAGSPEGGRFSSGFTGSVAKPPEGWTTVYFGREQPGESTGKPPPKPTTESIHRTWGKHTQRTDGWDPDRVALHNDLIHNLFEDSINPHLDQLYQEFDHTTPSIVFLVGSPGAGKSFWAETHLKPHHNFVHIDCDAIKANLPEYDPKDPNFVHKESVHVAKRALKTALKEGRSVIYDSTGVDVMTVEDAAHQAKKKGYHVAIHHIKVPLETALDRNSKRERVVPEHIVRSRHKEAQWAFNRFMENGVADYYLEHSND